MDNCPKCNVSLIGDPIPDDIKEHYSATHWRREIGVEIPELYDGVWYWKCPDCGHGWGGARDFRNDPNFIGGIK